jgi:hypothetical protein
MMKGNIAIAFAQMISIALVCPASVAASQAPVSSSFVEKSIERPFLDDDVDHSFDSP